MEHEMTAEARQLRVRAGLARGPDFMEAVGPVERGQEFQCADGEAL